MAADEEDDKKDPVVDVSTTLPGPESEYGHAALSRYLTEQAAPLPASPSPWANASQNIANQQAAVANAPQSTSAAVNDRNRQQANMGRDQNGDAFLAATPTFVDLDNNVATGRNANRDLNLYGGDTSADQGDDTRINQMRAEWNAHRATLDPADYNKPDESAPKSYWEATTRKGLKGLAQLRTHLDNTEAVARTSTSTPKAAAPAPIVVQAPKPELTASPVGDKPPDIKTKADVRKADIKKIQA